MEPGESEVQALCRELREELGIDVLEYDDEPTSRLHLPGDEPGRELHLSTWRVRTWRGQPSKRAGRQSNAGPATPRAPPRPNPPVAAA